MSPAPYVWEIYGPTRLVENRNKFFLWVLNLDGIGSCASELAGYTFCKLNESARKRALTLRAAFQMFLRVTFNNNQTTGL